MYVIIDFQSQCWEKVYNILSTWFSEGQKNTVFGFFGTCAFAGGIVGTALAVSLGLHYSMIYEN